MTRQLTARAHHGTGSILSNHLDGRPKRRLLIPTVLASALLIGFAPIAPALGQVLYGATGGEGEGIDGNGGDAGQAGSAGAAGTGGAAGTEVIRKGQDGLNGGGGGGGFSYLVSGDISISMYGGGGGKSDTSGGGGGGGDAVRNTDATPSISIAAGIQLLGGSGGLGSFSGGASGGGGAGLVLQNRGTVIVGPGATVVGGTGGIIVGGPGAGGGGGAGVIMNLGGAFTNRGVVQGGAGGFNGAGGAGVVMGGAGDVINEGTISGGFGMRAGHSGAGIDLRAGGSVMNTGRIVGLDGDGISGGGTGGPAGGTGSGGASGFVPNTPISGLGGIGIIGTGVRIINAGTISGGMVLGTSIPGSAITLSGNDNRLEIWDGSVIFGNATITGGGADNVFALGGAADSSFDASLIGVQYQGFTGFEKTGASTWTVSGETPVVTPWTLADGTLSISSNGSLGDTSGGLTFDGGTLQNTAAFSMARNVMLNAGGAVLRTDADLVVDSAIAGVGGLTKIGAGMLILNGVSTYSGSTIVNAGTLEVGDAATPSARIAGNVQVNAAGTLRGHGTVAGDVANQGTVRPGGSIGTLTIAGNYTQSPDGILMIDVSPTAASQLKVGGTATLAGTLSVLYGPGTYTAKTFRIIEANAVTGSFAAITGNTPGAGTQSVSIGADAVDLTWTAGTTPVTPVDPVIPVDPVVPVEPVAPVTPEAPVVVAPTHATIFGAVGSAALREGQRINHVLLDRLGEPCFLPAQDSGECIRPEHHVWIQAAGTDTRIDGNHGAPDVRDQRYGFLAGVDRRLSNGWTVGLAGGYSHADVTEDDTSAKGKLDTLRLAAYAGKDLGRVHVSGALGYAYHFLSTTRSFGTLGQAKGSGHGQEFNAGAQASIPWAVGRTIVTPGLGVRYAHIEGLGLSETGPTSQNLGVSKQRLNSLQPYVGVTLDYPYQSSNERSGSFQARVGYAYETQSTGRNVAVTAADGTGFVIPGTSDSRGMVTAGVGVTLPMGKAANAYVRYDALLPTGNVSSQSLQAGLSYAF